MRIDAGEPAELIGGAEGERLGEAQLAAEAEKEAHAGYHRRRDLVGVNRSVLPTEAGPEAQPTALLALDASLETDQEVAAPVARVPLGHSGLIEVAAEHAQVEVVVAVEGLGADLAYELVAGPDWSPVSSVDAREAISEAGGNDGRPSSGRPDRAEPLANPARAVSVR